MTDDSLVVETARASAGDSAGERAVPLVYCSADVLVATSAACSAACSVASLVHEMDDWWVVETARGSAAYSAGERAVPLAYCSADVLVATSAACSAACSVASLVHEMDVTRAASWARASAAGRAVGWAVTSAY